MNEPTNQPDPEATWVRRGDVLHWYRQYGPWTVTAESPVHAPFDGPSVLHIQLGISGTDPDERVTQLVDEATETDGIPASLLRQIPLAEMKGQARAALAQQEDRMFNQPYPVPKRCLSELDYVLLVAELARMRATGTTAPQGELASHLGIGKATMSERVKRATELGLWDGRQLTEQARTVLNQWHNEERGN
ncbi:helix-turn-helix domain-containing protein [Streptomyces zagrosensis]|uniref:Bacteriophage CI repressor N-terminal domain-containing protein n=1 Tax=Streptomyces zagrosensis TaxID=1042984 RepID=A0A7W9QEI8_9ACTN|nr:helix-turn-helix domain-containing protein [Streptomyces zagrosensis]MBB5938813.1 hypothetical protein [Streptomyces zagrosensis]